MSRYLLLGLLVFTGCVADQKGTQRAPAPVITVNTPLGSDTEAVKKGILEAVDTKIQTAVQTTQNQMSGLLNASELRLADKLTGVESRVDAKLDAALTASLNAQLNLKAELQNIMTAEAKLTADINNNISAVAKLAENVSANAAAIASLNTKMEGLAGQMTGQIGLINRTQNEIEQIRNEAGRDINYLPKEAAMVMIEQERQSAKTLMYVVSAMAAVISGAIAWLGKAAFSRANDERKAMNMLLLEMAMHVKPDVADKMQAKVAALHKK